MSSIVYTSNPHASIAANELEAVTGAPNNYSLYDSSNVPLMYLQFQTGPIPANGVNGWQIEDLVAVCIHRLEAFQVGDFGCRENAIAITKLEEAIHRLNDRTADRTARGVEGKYQR